MKKYDWNKLPEIINKLKEEKEQKQQPKKTRKPRTKKETQNA